MAATREAVIVGVADAALRDGMLAQPMTPLQVQAKVAAAAVADAKLSLSDVDGLPALGMSDGFVAIEAPTAAAADALRGREVWLVHPWSLRPPPADLPAGTEVIGLYLREVHEAWPWSEARWRWVDAAMAAVTPRRWWVDAATLAKLLAGATGVRSVDDPHIARWLRPLASLDPAPALFPPVERPCTSFSQWWPRASRGLRHASELLA